MNLGTLLPRHAQYTPNRPAVVFEDQRYNWREFNARVNQAAHLLLDLGLTKGAKIATILPNGIEVLDLYWAVAKTGMVIVPLSPMLRGEGLASLLRDSDAEAVITTAEMLEHIQPFRLELTNIAEGNILCVDADDLDDYPHYHTRHATMSTDEPPYVENQDEDLYNIIYSSGTTGLPKGIMHTHYIRGMYCHSFSTVFRIMPESVILHTGSLVFNGAFLTFMPAFYQGSKYVLHPYFDVERLIETVEKEKITHIMMVPSQIVAMLHHPKFDPSRMQSLEMIMTVGAPLHLEHKREFMEKLPGIFYELYGLTEGFMTVLDKLLAEEKPGSVGVPPPFYEMKILDPVGNEVETGQVGEIVGRGPMLMSGYYKRPDLTKNAILDGWLYSGDLGYVDEDGFLYLVDRKKDLIISGGINVYPKDIEEILVQHPLVVEASVFGVPDDKWGESPVAAVILKDGVNTEPSEIQDWVNERVNARYQKLKAVLIRDAFPRSVAGKTLKRVMRDEFWQDQDTKI